MLIIECHISYPQGKKYFPNHIHPARQLLRHITTGSYFYKPVYIIFCKQSQYFELILLLFLPYEILSGRICRCTSITTVFFQFVETKFN